MGIVLINGGLYDHVIVRQSVPDWITLAGSGTNECRIHTRHREGISTAEHVRKVKTEAMIGATVGSAIGRGQPCAR